MSRELKHQLTKVRHVDLSTSALHHRSCLITLATTKSSKSSLAEYLESSTYILSLIGAGLSAPSDIPTFQDEAIAGYDPRWLATRKAFEECPEQVLQYYRHRRRSAWHALLNEGHFALAELARWKPHSFTITQNIDGTMKRDIESFA